MSAGNRRALRATTVLVWLVLALIAVVPVLAQGTENPAQAGTSVQSTPPQTLNDVAARLSPLLVGAALIERTLEFLFSWSQRAVLDATSSLRGVASWISGLVEVDVRQIWQQMDQLTNAMVKAKSSTGAQAANPNSPDPSQWPLEKLQAQLDQVTQTLTEANAHVEQIMGSDLYKERRKVIAGVLSIAMGIVLALIANLRLFKPLDVTPPSWFVSPFNVIDLLLAGVLMGLGTDWVHQVINILTKGQSLLGARAEAVPETVDTSQIEDMASQAIQQAFDQRLQDLRSQVEQGISDVTQRSQPAQPPSEPPSPPH
jgi:hypothetical protein